MFKFVLILMELDVIYVVKDIELKGKVIFIVVLVRYIVRYFFINEF